MRPCLDCGCACDGSRCGGCQAKRLALIDGRRGTPAERGYDKRHRRLSARARRLVDFCEDCAHRGSPDNPLTVEHKVWPALSLADYAAVLCRRCNSKRGALRSRFTSPAVTLAGTTGADAGVGTLSTPVLAGKAVSHPPTRLAGGDAL